MDGCIALHSNDFLYNVKTNWNSKNHFCLKNKEVIFWGDLSCFRGTSTYQYRLIGFFYVFAQPAFPGFISSVLHSQLRSDGNVYYYTILHFYTISYSVLHFLIFLHICPLSNTVFHYLNSIPLSFHVG